MSTSPRIAFDPKVLATEQARARQFKSRGLVYPGAIVQTRVGSDVMHCVPDDQVDATDGVVSTGLAVWGPMAVEFPDRPLPCVVADGVIHYAPIATLDRHRPRCARGFVAAIIARIDFLISLAEGRAWVPGSDCLTPEQIVAGRDAIYDEFRLNCRGLLASSIAQDSELRLALAENMNNTRLSVPAAKRLQAGIVLLSLEPALPAHSGLQPVDPLAVDRQAAARLLGISLRKLDELVAGRRIPFRRVGRRVLFAKASLEGWVEKQSVR